MLLAVLCALTAGPAYGGRRPARAQTPANAGPALAEILHEMQKPLPPLEDSDAPYLRELAQPPELGENDASQWPNRFRGFFVYASLFVFGWCIATGRVTLPRRVLARAGSWYEPPRRKPMTIASATTTFRRAIELRKDVSAATPKRPFTAPAPVTQLPTAKPTPARPAQRPARPEITAPAAVAPTTPAAALTLTPEPLSKSQIIHFKALTSFSSWRDLLTAARAGNRVAREVLDSSPAHAAITFELSATDFTRDFAWVRNIVLSRTWVDAILALLRTTEQFDRDLTITTPFGARRTLPLSAPITALNSVLGYEELPAHIRRQLELRRWILWHTRTDGQEHPEVLIEFAADTVAQASAAGL
jgi:hypothetical protein